MGIKKKFLSQAETEASVSPMIDLLNGKKHKKDKKKKLMAATDGHLNESFDDDAFKVTKKKDKKNKNGAADNSMNNCYEEVFEASEGKKKKKSKKRQESISDNPDMNDNSYLMEPEESPKKDKKKKKKSGMPETSFVKEEDLDLNESSHSHSSPKKKKGKILDSESSFNLKSSKEGKEFESPGKVLSSKSDKKRKQEAAEELDSPSHKKKKVRSVPSKRSSHAEGLCGNDHEMETAPEKNVIQTDILSMNIDSLWTPEEEVDLLNRIRESLPSSDEAVPYKKSLLKISWDDIAFGSRSAQDCNDKLNQLISKLIKQKSLSMLLGEAEQYCKGEKNIKVPRDRFVQLYFKKRKAEPSYSPDQNTEILREANLVWSAMPEEEKEEYEVQYRNELKKYKKSLDLPPDLPRMPVSIYYDVQVKKLRKKSNELRKMSIKTFNEMNFDDKVPYIHESVKELYNYHKAAEAYQNSHPEWKEERRIRLSHALFQDYLEYLSMPKCKINGFTTYLEHIKRQGELDNVIGKDKLKHATSMYQALSEEERQSFAKMAKLNQNCFGEKYKAWLEQQDEAVALLAQKYYAPKLHGGIASLHFSHCVEMNMTKPRFSEEPNKPPTALKLFQMKFERRFGDRYREKETLRNDCLAAWKGMSPKDKAVYLNRAKQNLELYKETLLEYVGGLGQSASVYLGFKRAEFCKYFKEDIFEKDFPNEEYPVFVSPKKKGPSDQKSPKKKEDEDPNDSESEASLSDTGPVKGSRKSGGKGATAAASSDDEDEDDDDDVEDEEETEVAHSWNAGKQSSVKKQKASVYEGDDEEDEEEEEEDDDEEEESD